MEFINVYYISTGEKVAWIFIVVFQIKYLHEKYKWVYKDIDYCLGNLANKEHKEACLLHNFRSTDFKS